MLEHISHESCSILSVTDAATGLHFLESLKVRVEKSQCRVEKLIFE
jgi:hypothetical protein